MSKELDDIIMEHMTNKGLTQGAKIHSLLTFDPYSTKVKMTWQEIDDDIRRIHIHYNAILK